MSSQNGWGYRYLSGNNIGANVFKIQFSNSTERAVFLQVDPWACLYRLQQGDCIELAMDCSGEEPSFSFDEHDSENRILTLWNCDDFFIIRDGMLVHWRDFQTNT
jgi:hypothetical protein